MLKSRKYINIIYRISSNKRCPLINALAGMYLILINAALLINALAGMYLILINAALLLDAAAFIMS